MGSRADCALRWFWMMGIGGHSELSLVLISSPAASTDPCCKRNSVTTVKRVRADSWSCHVKLLLLRMFWDFQKSTGNTLGPKDKTPIFPYPVACVTCQANRHHVRVHDDDGFRRSRQGFLQIRIGRVAKLEAGASS
jgi:hypothetical protein